ncbi:unnamed protein product [Macrosiphum euphorbiae]|uniref:Uncharacterized protein n=1 Tax=Macrosiphum euphorbiae TaxID=13131 RepID=A0AAV0XMY1_9HEMI|nr:unnamed protein product [Macrosiphum euphorbiae]
MQNTNHKKNVTGSGCKDSPGPAVGSTWCASQWSNRSNCSTTTGNAQLNTEIGLNKGDKTITDLITIGPLGAEITGSLDKLFNEISQLVMVRCKYLVPIRDRSSVARDSDDDSSDSDEDECRHQSDVRLPEKPNAEIGVVSTRYYFRVVKKSPPRSASRLWLAFDERMNRSFSSESQSEELWSLDLEQPWPSDRELSSGSRSPSVISLKVKSASHSELNPKLNWSIEDELFWPSSVMHAWFPSDSELWSASHSELQWSLDDEEVLPTNVMQMYPTDSDHWSSSHSGVKWTTDDEQSLPSNSKQTLSSMSELCSESKSKLKCTTDDDKQLQPSNSKQTRSSKSGLCSESKSKLKCTTDDDKQLHPSNSKQTRSSKLGLNSESNSKLKCPTDYEQLQPSTVKQTWLTDSALRLQLHSELMWSTSKGQLDKTDSNQMWLSDSDLRTASYSDLMGSTGSMDTDELGPSDLKQKWPIVSELRSVTLSEPLMSSDDEQIFSIADEQMVSLHDEEEINVVSINEADEDATVAEPPTPKRRSFLSALGRRVLSACRKLICCGVCGRCCKR